MERAKKALEATYTWRHADHAPIPPVPHPPITHTHPFLSRHPPFPPLGHLTQPYSLPNPIPAPYHSSPPLLFPTLPHPNGSHPLLIPPLNPHTLCLIIPSPSPSPILPLLPISHSSRHLSSLHPSLSYSITSFPLSSNPRVPSSPLLPHSALSSCPPPFLLPYPPSPEPKDS